MQCRGINEAKGGHFANRVQRPVSGTCCVYRACGQLNGGTYADRGVRTESLCGLILGSVRRLTRRTVGSTSTFCRQLDDQVRYQCLMSTSRARGRQGQLRIQGRRVSKVFLDLCASGTGNVLARRQFVGLATTLRRRRRTGRGHLRSLTIVRDQTSTRRDRIQAFVGRVQHCTTVTRLSRSMLGQLVDGVLVNRIGGISNRGIRRIEVICGFIKRVPRVTTWVIYPVSRFKKVKLLL